jgi:hypothetical protein
MYRISPTDSTLRINKNTLWRRNNKDDHEPKSVALLSACLKHSFDCIVGSWAFKKYQVWCVPCPCTILYKNTNHQQMHRESFIINCNALLHVSTLLGHLQGEPFCYHYTKVALYSWVRMCCWLCTEGVNSLWSRRASRDRREFTPSKSNAVHSQQHILTQL